MDAFQILIFERNRFEEELYNLLITPLIDDSFWDPVKVSLTPEQIDSLTEKEIIQECFICSEEHNLFNTLPCCNKEMCKDCVNIWFNESVKCPYCKFDIRET
jgi:hypothetical protein